MKKATFFLKSLNVYLRYKTKNYLPFLLIFTLTNRCNLKCKYCFNGATAFNKKWDLPLSAVYSAIDDVLRLKIPVISFTGGEPLLHKNFNDICNYIEKKPIISNLNTNGTLINKSNARLIANSFDFVRISLNGIGKTHDTITGIKGSHDKTLSAIDYLMSIKTRRAKIGINIVVNKETFMDLNPFIASMQNKADFISLLPEFCFDQNPKTDVNKTLKELNVQEITNTDIISNTKEFLNSLSLTKYELCDAGKLYLSIFSDGSVVKCPFFKRGTLISKNKEFILGNLKTTTLVDILKNKNFKFQNYNCNGCYATCTSEITRIFRMNPLKLMWVFPKLLKGYRLL